MTFSNIKRCSTSLTKRKIQIKTKQITLLTHQDWQKFKSLTKYTAREATRKRHSSLTAYNAKWDEVLWDRHRSNYIFSFTSNPATLILKIYHDNTPQNNMKIPMAQVIYCSFLCLSFQNNAKLLKFRSTSN